MDQKAKARDLQERACEPGHPWGPGRGLIPEVPPDQLAEARALAQDELDVLQSRVIGHHWDGWRSLTGDEKYFAACSCGWCSTQTGMNPMLRQVKEHLDAVREIRGGRPSTQQAPRDEHGRDASQGTVQRQERARELSASVEGQQMRLSQSLKHSMDLLSASTDQADRLVSALERGQWVRRRVSASSAGIVLERARELRQAIAGTAATLAVIAEEITWIHQDLEACRPAGYRSIVGVTSETAGTAREAGRTQN